MHSTVHTAIQRQSDDSRPRAVTQRNLTLIRSARCIRMNGAQVLSTRSYGTDSSEHDAVETSHNGRVGYDTICRRQDGNSWPL